MIPKILNKGKNSTFSSLFAGIVVIMAMFMVVGCEKEESGIIDSLVSQDPKDVLYNLKVNDNGVIVFRDFEEYNIVIKSLETMGERERLEWEKEIGFQSLSSFLLGASDEISQASSEEEFFSSLKKYSDYFEIVELENGELSVEKKITETLYNKFSGINGQFIIGDTVYRYFACGKLAYSSVDNKDFLINSNSEDLCLLESNRECTVVNVFCSNSLTKEFSGLVDTLRGEAMYDPSGNSNDRWVKIKIMAYYQLNTGNDYYGKVQIQVYGKKKNFLGNWVYYKTIYSHRDVTYSLQYQKSAGSAIWHPNSHSFADMQSDEEEREFYTYYTFDDDIRYSPGFQPAPGFYFTDLFAEGSSRGMNNIWAQIDY
jgi:hypothetical protein